MLSYSGIPWFGVGLWECVLRGGALMWRFISSKGFVLWYICSNKETLFTEDIFYCSTGMSLEMLCVVKSLTQYYSMIQIRIKECKGKLSAILLLSGSSMWQNSFRQSPMYL